MATRKAAVVLVLAFGCASAVAAACRNVQGCFELDPPVATPFVETVSVQLLERRAVGFLNVAQSCTPGPGSCVSVRGGERWRLRLRRCEGVADRSTLGDVMLRVKVAGPKLARRMQGTMTIAGARHRIAAAEVDCD